MKPDAAQRTFRERAVDAANRFGERFLRWLDRYFGRHSAVGDTTFFDPADFPWVERLEAGFPQIRAELDEVLRYHADLPNFQDISTDQAQLTLDTDDGQLTLTVSDRGRGLQDEQAEGAGLRGMRERATLIGAQLRIERGPSDEGTRLRLVIPVDEQP